MDIATLITNSVVGKYTVAYQKAYEKYLDHYGADIAMSKAINEALPCLVEELVKNLIDLKN